MNVAVWEKDFLELVRDALCHTRSKAFSTSRKNAAVCLRLAAGLGYALDEDYYQMMSGRVRLTKAELFEDQHLQSFEVVSYTTLYEFFNVADRRLIGRRMSGREEFFPGFGIMITFAVFHFAGK